MYAQHDNKRASKAGATDMRSNKVLHEKHCYSGNYCCMEPITSLEVVAVDACVG